MKRPGIMAREVLRYVLAKPATTKYPFEKAVSPQNFRGKIIFDFQKCIGCKMCERDCPTGAITIAKVAEKTFEATFDLDKCIYCAQCVDSCPKKALEASPVFELAVLDRSKLKEVFHASPLPPVKKEEE